VCPANTGKDRQIMSDKTATSLFMFSPLASKYAEFYQGLLRGVASYQQLGNKLIQLGEQAHAFRQFDRVREIGQVLSSIPIKDYQAIGNYFLAVAANSMGNGDQDTAQKLFEIAAQTAPDKYKGRAIMSLAALSAHKQDFANELYFFQESLKAGKDLYTILKAHKGIAVIQAREGYHKHSLKYLESFLPLIRYAEPHVYSDYLNSYAVELGEAGRAYEARNVSNLVIASPFAPAYPEWQETAKDLKEPNRAFISVPSIEPGPVEIEAPVETEARPKVVPIQAHQAIEPEEPASVISFPPLREAPRPEQPKLLKSQELEYMNLAEKREFIMAAIKSGRIPESEYKKMIYLLGLVESGPANQIIDLEDAALLNSIIMRWCNLIEPEQFAAVMSALRDCKEDWRRKAIMDEMIAIAYQQTSSNINSEREWREKVECRLPEK
jgi:hypothetical protein